MARVCIEKDEFEVPDGEAFLEQAEQAGVPFGCQDGQCGTCRCIVEEGMQNLTPRTQEELDMDLDINERLICQCKIKQGIVKFRYW